MKRSVQMGVLGNAITKLNKSSAGQYACGTGLVSRASRYMDDWLAERHVTWMIGCVPCHLLRKSEGLRIFSTDSTTFLLPLTYYHGLKDKQ